MMLAGTALASGLVTVVPGLPAAAVDNPPIEETCGVDVTLVLDASGSIQSSNAVENVRDAAEAFLDSLRNTNSTARVTQFATVSEELAPSTLVDDASLDTGGVLGRAITRYYDPKPPRPPDVAFHQYRGSGNPQSASSWTNGTSDQYTNWDQGLDQAGTRPGELVVFVTDGDPTAYDFNQAGDPFDPGPPPDVGYNTDRGEAAALTLNRAVAEADQIKNGGTRILAVGVGNALDNQQSVNRLVAVSGPQVVRNQDLANLDSLNDVDVALVTNFANLAAFLRSVVLQLCSPSLTIRKLAQTATNSDYVPTAGWSITATPDTENGQFDWILPNTTPTASKTLTTNADGFVQFQWEPDPGEQDSSAVVSEDVKTGFTPGRPGANNDFRCELRDEDGNVRVVQGELTAAQGQATFELDPIGQEIVTCSLFNSFDYEPEINITKVNAPTAVRGDLIPPATVTSTYAVTNPGNTPLSNVTVTDNRCAPVLPVLTGGFNVGDTNRNNLLNRPETWQFTCTRATVVSRGRAAAPTVNTATVTGTDPEGTTVTDTADDDVDVFVPHITLTKLVNGEDFVIVEQGTEVTYTYAATNTGDTPLGTVTLTDDPPCTPIVPDPGNTAPPLLPGQTWNFSCTDTPLTDVVDTATVTGIPLNPNNGNNPFPAPNPPVSDTDPAEVQVINPNVDLTKTVDPEIVLLAPTPGATEPVTYTFEATNTGVPALNRPGATTAGPAKDPGWVTDPHCTSPATYVDNGGDANDNDLFDPGETWTFTCPGVVDGPTINIAEIIGQPADDTGAPLPNTDPVDDMAAAFVDVLRPGIDIVKTALVPVVLDPDAPAVSGPDVPDRRPAQYLYEVTNTGNVELGLGAGPADDICSPLTLLEGDTDTDELLDPDETWVYGCETTLGREQANTPPVTGNESGLVTNTVAVTGVPFYQEALVPEKSVTADDIAQVTVIEPGISITKRPSARVVRPNEVVTYTYLVRNTGDVGLDVLGPQDDKCADLTFVGGDRPPANGLLDGADSARPEVWTYRCTRPIGTPAPPATTDVNTVSVGAIDPLGNLYRDQDNAVVRVFEPAINLTKTVSDSLVPVGTRVTYQFVATNVGTSPIPADDVLADNVLVDLASPPIPSCRRPTFVGGDTNGNNLLDREPREAWRYRCTAVITEATTNGAVVRGTGGLQFDPSLPLNVFDVDAAFVQPFSPGIEVVKSASPTELVGRGEVTYTYQVRNTGDVPLAGVAESISDDTCSPVTFVRGDRDGDGLLDTPNSIFEDALDETWIFTCTTTIDETTTNTVVVTGNATGTDGTSLCDEGGPAGESALQQADPCVVSDQDDATVTVTEPGTVTITKRTTVFTTQGFSFTRRSETFRLGRDETRTMRNLVPGTHVVIEATASGWALSTIACSDPTNNTVIVIADRRVEIHVATGETVRCTFTNRVVVRPPGNLPATGNSGLATPLTVAALLTAVGVAMVAIGRWRRRLVG
jgi:hypothetical protein